jgi:cell division protein FtsZ
MANMEQFTIVESNTAIKPRVVAVNVRGNGEKIADDVFQEQTPGIELIFVNMDEDESRENLRETLEGTDIVFIVMSNDIEIVSVCIAKIAKEAGALTIAMVDKNSHYEVLKNVVDSVVVLPNDKINSNINNIYAQVINGISGVILANGKNDINLDFLDLKTIMCHGGIAVTGIGEYQGKNAAVEAINSAMNSPLLIMPIKKASGVLVHFYMHSEYNFIDISSAMEVVHRSIDNSADIIFGTTTDESLPHDFIHITLVAAGFEKRVMLAVNNI